MKKLALALIAVLLFSSALPARSAMLSEYVDQTFAATEQDEYTQLEQKLLSVFKKIAAVSKQEQDKIQQQFQNGQTAQNEEEITAQQMEAVSSLIEKLEYACEDLWQEADNLLAGYVKEITDEVAASYRELDADDFEELNIQFRAEISNLLEQSGIAVSQEKLSKIDFTDLAFIKNTMQIAVISTFLQDFLLTQKLTQEEIALMALPLNLYTLNKLQDFIPADAE